MSYTITWLNVLGLAAGILILAVGAFVLYARPRGTINRAFFGLALLSGIASILFEFWAMADEPGLQALFNATYYYHFIAFLFFLFAFGLLFPRPLGGARAVPWIIGGTGLAAALSIAALALRPDWFWVIAEVPGAVFVQDVSGGRLVNIGFWIASIAVLTKLVHDLLSANSSHERRTAALFVAAMGIGYATSFAANLIFSLKETPETFLRSPDPIVTLAHSIELLATIALLTLVAWLFREREILEPRIRRVLVGTLLAMAVLVSARFVSSNGFTVSQILGLVAYPLILAYAIVTQEAFDINPQVRNAAAVGAAGAVFAAGFVIGEDFLQDVLAAGFLGEVASPVAVQAISAVLAAAINLPIFMGARRLAQRAFSGAVVDPKHLGNLATYRLVLEGALEDGILGARESKALKTLREELGISQREHQEIAAQVHASFQDRHAGADELSPTGDPAEGA